MSEAEDIIKGKAKAIDGPDRFFSTKVINICSYIKEPLKLTLHLMDCRCWFFEYMDQEDLDEATEHIDNPKSPWDIIRVRIGKEIKGEENSSI